MKMVGHKTQSIYSRYAIADEGMLKDAALKLGRLHEADEERLRKPPRSRKEVEKQRREMELPPKTKNPKRSNSIAKQPDRNGPHFVSAIIFSNLFYRSGREFIK
jgi:hypothetical protein